MFTMFMISKYVDSPETHCNVDCSPQLSKSDCASKNLENRGSSWKQSDGKCKCICNDNWTGENCDKCKSGYYEDVTWDYSNNCSKNVCNKCTTCRPEKGEYQIGDCVDGQDIICSTCPENTYVDPESNTCNLCTDCDTKDGNGVRSNRFKTKCLLNAGSVCEPNTCEQNQFNNEGNCQDCTVCKTGEKILQDCTGTYDRKCVTECPNGYFEDEDKICKKCQTCKSNEVEVVQCTKTNDRKCLECASGEYSHNNLCVLSPCENSQYFDLKCLELNSNETPEIIKEKCCKDCHECNNDTNKIYAKSCSVTENSVCSHECPSDDYFIESIKQSDGSTKDICIKCKSCKYNEAIIQECSNENGDITTQNTRDRICIPAGKIPYPYSVQFCPSCFPETTDNEIINSDYTRYKKCKTQRSCTEETKDLVCGIESAFTGNCVNNLCEVKDENYCSGEEGTVGLDICDKNANYPKVYEDDTPIETKDLLLDGSCSDIDSDYYYKKSDKSVVIGPIHDSFISPLKGSQIPSDIPQYKARANIKGMNWITPEKVNYGDGCFVYDSRGRYNNQKCNDPDNPCPDSYTCIDSLCRKQNPVNPKITEPVDYKCIFNPSEYSKLKTTWCSDLNGINCKECGSPNEEGGEPCICTEPDLCVDSQDMNGVSDMVDCGVDERNVPVSCYVDENNNPIKYKSI